MNAEARLATVRARLAAAEPDALWVSSIANVVYLTGFDGVFDEFANAACLITADTARVYTDSRYEEAASQAAAGTPWTVTRVADSLEAAACADLVEVEGGTIGFETSLSYARFRALAEACGSEPVAAEKWVEDVRAVKEAVEVDCIERAAALADHGFDHILGVLAPGVSEAEVALEVESFMRRNGSEGVAFPSIIASGPNSSRPHATVTQRRIEPGDPVTLDFGARVGGYCSDMTRTVVVGRATPEFRRVYECVRTANELGRQTLRGGMPGVEIDRVVRGALERDGLAEHFGHGLGHGVGLEVHEAPTLSPKGLAPVLTGAVVTIEPGVYVPGRFGVRIEDLVVVEDGGCRALSTSPRDLIEL